MDDRLSPDDTFDASFLVNTPTPADRILPTSLTDRALRHGDPPSFHQALSRSSSLKYVADVPGAFGSTPEKGKSVRFDAEEKKPAGVGGVPQLFKLGSGNMSTPVRDEGVFGSGGRRSLETELALTPPAALGSGLKRSPTFPSPGATTSTRSTSSAPLIKSSPSIYPPLPPSFTSSQLTPRKQALPPQPTPSRQPATPQLTKQSILVPISLKAGAGGVKRVGTARMAQRMRANMVAFGVLWWLGRTRPYRYFTGKLVIALPAIDTPLYLLEWCLTLLFLYNILEALYKLNFASSAPSTVVVPMSPYEKLEAERQLSSGKKSGTPLRRMALGMPVTKQSPLTRPSSAPPSAPSHFQLFSSPADSSPSDPLSPLNLASPLPKSTRLTTASSNSTVVHSPSPLGRSSSLRSSSLGASKGSNGGGGDFADVFAAKQQAVGGGSPFGRSSLGYGSGLSRSVRKVSDSRAVDRIIAEAF